MHFLFNKSDNSYCFHTEDENDINLTLIADSDRNFYVHIPDFNVEAHPDLYGADDICCLFWDEDTKTTYIDKSFINPNYSHGKAYLTETLQQIVANNTGVELNEAETFIVYLARQFLSPELFKRITADSIIDKDEASDALEELLDNIVNEVNNGEPS